MPTPPIFFSCHFCSFKTKIQVDLNAHYLFIHFFENPDCTVSTPFEVENYMYSKDHFKKCMACFRNETTAIEHPDQYTTKELTNVRSMINYLCATCYDDYDSNKIKQECIDADKRIDEMNDNGKKSNYYLRRYNKFNRLTNGVWQYIQSITLRKVRMYEKTLHRIHVLSSLEIKPLDQSFVNRYVNPNDTFISNKYYGKERKKQQDEKRIE